MPLDRTQPLIPMIRRSMAVDNHSPHDELLGESGVAGAVATVAGTIMDMEDGVARILIGPRDEEWWFPTTMLPLHVRAGDALDFASEGGRYLVIGASMTDDDARNRSIEDRLSRPLSAKKTEQVDARALRRQLRG